MSVALLSSLLPTVFPQTHPMTFLAALLPGLYAISKEQRPSQPLLQPKVERMAELLLEQQAQQLTVHDDYRGFPIADVAVSHLESNQQAWNCVDVGTDVLLKVLQGSMER